MTCTYEAPIADWTSCRLELPLDRDTWCEGCVADEREVERKRKQREDDEQNMLVACCVASTSS